MDVVVAPDGSLFIAIGGRKTRGAVFRIDYVGEPDTTEVGRREPIGLSDPLINLVLGAPQPLDAWSLGRIAPEKVWPLLNQLAQDSNAMVRRAALEAVWEQSPQLTGVEVASLVLPAAGDTENRVRQLAAALAARLPPDGWQTVTAGSTNNSLQSRVTLALAGLWRDTNAVTSAGAVEAGLVALAAPEPDLQLQAVRLLMLALGDWHLYEPSVELYTGYELSRPYRPLAELYRPGGV